MDDRLPGIRPRQSWGRRLDMAARRGFPRVVTVLLLLLASAPFGLSGQPQIQFAVALASVFFWSLFRPASMPPLVVFGLGVVVDLLGYAPLGTNVVILLALHAVATAGRRFLARGGFVMVWLAFAMLAAVAAGSQWLLTAVLTLRLLPVLPAVFAALLAAGLYPLLAVPFARAQRSLAEPERA